LEEPADAEGRKIPSQVSLSHFEDTLRLPMTSNA
jgi:hypothetical protein